MSCQNLVSEKRCSHSTTVELQEYPVTAKEGPKNSLQRGVFGATVEDIR